MISIITVNFNNARATVSLLKSLESQTDAQFDVLVVDNASTPNERSRLGSFAGTSSLNLDVIYSEENRGFSGGNNVAIRKALEQGAEWVVLLNNDTTVPDDFIASLRAGLPHTPAVIGIPLREGGRVAYAGIIRWLRFTLLHVYDRSRLTAQSSKLLYAIGAGVAIHRDVVERIGFMDERYFLYFEDAEFSMRAQRAGVPVLFLDAPVLTHGVSESTSRLGSVLLLRYHARNALLFNRTHGPWWVQTVLPITAIYGIVFQFLKVVFMPSRRAPSRAILDGILDFYAKRFGQINAAPQG